VDNFINRISTGSKKYLWIDCQQLVDNLCTSKDIQKGNLKALKLKTNSNASPKRRTPKNGKRTLLMQFIQFKLITINNKTIKNILKIIKKRLAIMLNILYNIIRW